MEIKQIPHLKEEIITELFGTMPDGSEIFTYRLTNRNGMELSLINYGATVTAVKVPLVNGELVDVVLGFDSLEKYMASFDLPAAPYFGATVGRFAGRINQGLFNLNGKSIQLQKNNNQHSLHGGSNGYSQVVWNAEVHQSFEGASVTFGYLSSNGEEFFPGNLEIKVTYTLTQNNEIKVKFYAVCDEDTIINLTHHSYFNLDGHTGDIKNQQLFVNAGFMLETTDDNIPTGRFVELKNHPYQFNPPKPCPTTIDNTFILSKNPELATSLWSIKNKLRMNVYTDTPGVHIYVGGNCFNQIEGKENTTYHHNSGICFETQNFPDAPNHEHFPSAVLKKGAIYQQQTTFKFENTAS